MSVARRPDDTGALRQLAKEIATSSDAWTPELRDRAASYFTIEASRRGHHRPSPAHFELLSEAYRAGEVYGERLCLDVGCGTGWYLGWLRLRHRTVVGVDLCTAMLDIIETKGMCRIAADAAYLPVRSSSTSAVISINTFVFPSEVDRVLAKAGVLVVAYTEGDATPISVGFETLLEALGCTWTVTTGHVGPGTWAVFRREE